MAYLTATTLDEALNALAQGPVAVIAGGTDWFPQAPDRLTDVPMVDITALPDLRGIDRRNGVWRIGAATSWTTIAQADLPSAFDGLRAAARQVGALQIQNAGTIGGNVCNASPAADGVPPLLTLDAQVELVSARGRRVLALGDFLRGPRQTARAADELLSAVLIPDPAPDMRSGFFKLGARRHLVISIAMVAVSLRVQGGRIHDARVAVGACAPVARRLAELETALNGHDAHAPLPAITLAELSPLSDVRATADYRLEAVAEVIARLLADLTAQGARADG